MSVYESPRKHAATQAQKKEKLSTKNKGKVVDLETEEGMKDIYTEGVDPMSEFLDYIPPCKGKVKITKGLDVEKLLIHTPLLSESITFEGLNLSWIPHL